MDIFHLFCNSKDLVYLLFFLSLCDLGLREIQLVLNKHWSYKEELNNLWKKISNFFLLFLSGAIDYIFSRNGIYFEISFVHIFSCLLILVEIDSILKN